MTSPPPAVLVFSATDPSGGAGMQADILTLASMGCHPLCVVTGVTIQDTTGVEDVLPLDAEWVADQARCILEDVPVSVFKLGVLCSVEAIATIAEIVSDYPDVPLVLDPILASGRGDELASEDMLAALRELIIPQATIVTPNTLEILRIAYDEPPEEGSPDFEMAARRVLETGCEYVLVTGTHTQSTQVINTLYGREGVIRTDGWERLSGSFHGSGCTLSAAIAAGLAQGLDIAEAVAEAQEFTWQTLKEGFRLGMGQPIPDRLFWAREEPLGDVH